MTLQPVTRRIAQQVLDDGPVMCTFENGAPHGRIPQAMDIAIRGIIDSGAAAAPPAVWLIVRRTDGQTPGDLGIHGPPDTEGCVEIGYTLAPPARGKGIGNRRRCHPGPAPGDGAGTPPAHRGHQRPQHRLPAPA